MIKIKCPICGDEMPINVILEEQYNPNYAEERAEKYPLVEYFGFFCNKKGCQEKLKQEYFKNEL